MCEISFKSALAWLTLYKVRLAKAAVGRGVLRNRFAVARSGEVGGEWSCARTLVQLKKSGPAFLAAESAATAPTGGLPFNQQPLR